MERNTERKLRTPQKSSIILRSVLAAGVVGLGAAVVTPEIQANNQTSTIRIEQQDILSTYTHPHPEEEQASALNKWIIWGV